MSKIRYNELSIGNIYEDITRSIAFNTCPIRTKSYIVTDPDRYYDNTLMPKIKKVIFNDPCTIVLWADGTKTVVRKQKEDKKKKFDKEKGLAMAIAKKALGNQGRYFEEFKKWVE